MNTNTTKKIFLPFVIVLVFLLNSCFGMSMDIHINRDGSARLTIEYRISRMLANLGELDGNTAMPVIPFGREDLERTVNRIEGARIVSYSNRNNSQDTVINAVIEFSNPQALEQLLDYTSGNKVSVSVNSGHGNMDLIILDNSAQLDLPLTSLMQGAFNGYNFSISFSAPVNSVIAITDGSGNTKAAPVSASITPSGRRVSFSMGMYETLSLSEGLGFKINW